jgi:hypothetical protein
MTCDGLGYRGESRFWCFDCKGFGFDLIVENAMALSARLGKYDAEIAQLKAQLEGRWIAVTVSLPFKEVGRILSTDVWFFAKGKRHYGHLCYGPGQPYETPWFWASDEETRPKFGECEGDRVDYKHEDVTHWQPLPPSPSGEPS